MTELLAPVNNPDEVKLLADAGADAFYCGWMSDEVRTRYSNIFSLNFRHNERANFVSFSSLKKAADNAHILEKPLYFTANSTPLNGQFSLLEEEVGRVIEEIQPSGILVGDISVLLFLSMRFKGVPWFMGSKGGVFNSATARLYASLGISRIIIPRHLTPAEWRDMMDAAEGTKLEFEVFVKNERCHFPNAFCKFEHGISEAEGSGVVKMAKMLKKLAGGGMEMDMPFEKPHRSFFHKTLYEYVMRTRGHTCLGTFKVMEAPAPVMSKKEKKLKLYRKTECFFDACGACEIFPFVRDGSLKGVKIVGRGTATERKLMDVRFIRSALDLALNETDESVFGKKVRREYRKIYGKACTPRLCYHSYPPRNTDVKF